MDDKKNALLKKYRRRQLLIRMLPFAALLILLIVFCGVVQSRGYRLPMYLKIVFNESVVLSIVATGATFIYTLGSFDISLGASTLFSATVGVMAYNATGSFPLMLLVIFAVRAMLKSRRRGGCSGCGGCGSCSACHGCDSAHRDGQ